MGGQKGFDGMTEEDWRELRSYVGLDENWDPIDADRDDERGPDRDPYFETDLDEESPDDEGEGGDDVGTRRFEDQHLRNPATELRWRIANSLMDNTSFPDHHEAHWTLDDLLNKAGYDTGSGWGPEGPDEVPDRVVCELFELIQDDAPTLEYLARRFRERGLRD